MPKKNIIQEFRQLHKHLSPFLTKEQNLVMKQMSSGTEQKYPPVPTTLLSKKTKQTHEQRVSKHLKF